MAQLLDRDGTALTWAELHARVAAYWATHERSGQLLADPPGVARTRAVLDLARGLQEAADSALGAYGDADSASIPADGGGASAGAAAGRREHERVHAPMIPRSRRARS